MKKILLLLSLLLMCLEIMGQYGPKQIISSATSGPNKSIPYDLDQDGFLDVITSSYGEGIIVWHRNANGLGDFEPPQTLFDDAIVIEDMKLIDIDGDHDIDILYKTNLDKLAWLENINGLGNFSNENLIANTFYPYTMEAGDLDGDGDLDIISMVHSTSTLNSIIWYENIDGQGSFNSGITIDTFIDFSFETELMDVDNDADLDILVSVLDVLVWYENTDGNANFASPVTISEFTENASDIYKALQYSIGDLDGDGLEDIVLYLQHYKFNDKIVWLKNEDGLGNFLDPEVIYVYQNTNTVVVSLSLFDLDLDNDLDVLLGEKIGNNFVSWLENADGLGTFNSKYIITTQVDGLRDVNAADLNQDGDLDVISTSYFNNEVAWYEYTGVFGISENKIGAMTLYPNPTNDMVYIQSKHSIDKISVFNHIGALLSSEANTSEINMEAFQVGMYLLSVEAENGTSEVFKIFKK